MQEKNMADVKQQFINALNTTPEGIDDFLETPIPVVASISNPTDVDGAIVAQGQLAYNINEILRAFGGLTIVELLLRIGQHNSVLQGALLAALEYTKKTSIEFTIESPVSATLYFLPDESLECRVTFEDEASFSKCTGISVEIFANNPEQSSFNETIRLTGEIENLCFSGECENIINKLGYTTLVIEMTARFIATFEKAETYTKAIDFGVTKVPV